MIDSDINNKLKVSQPLKYLNLAEREVILNYGKILTVSAKEIIVRQGKISQGMHIILNGEARVALATLAKDPLQLATLKPGDFFGEIGLIQRVPAIATVIASKKTEILFFSNKNFDALCVYFPEIKFKITKAIIETICVRLEILNTKIKNLLKKIKTSKFNKQVQTKQRIQKTTLAKINIPLKTLKKTNLFRAYDHDELDILTQKLNLIVVPKNHIIANHKKQDHFFYIILRGAVQLSIVEKKSSAKLGILPPSSIFGDVANICNASSMVTYSTCEKSILMKISAKQLDEFYKTHKDIWYKLYHNISKSVLGTQIFAGILLKRLTIEKYHG